MLRKGDIIFSRDNSWISKLIRLRTLSNWSHCGVFINDFDLIISAEFDGVVVTPLDEWLNMSNREYQVLRIKDVNEEQINEIVEFMESKEGSPYHFLGLLNFILFKEIKDGKRWFCSQLVHEALKSAEIYPFDGRRKSSFVSPADLYENPLLKIV